MCEINIYGAFLGKPKLIWLVIAIQNWRPSSIFWLSHIKGSMVWVFFGTTKFKII